VKVGLIHPRQRVALAHESASVDKPRGYLAADAEGKIAFDARLDDPGKNLRLLARSWSRKRISRPSAASAVRSPRSSCSEPGPRSRCMAASWSGISISSRGTQGMARRANDLSHFLLLA
jgi:hypothetical protein